MNCDSSLACFQLRNGVRMPALGLGTSHSGGYSHDAVVYALRDCGYRLIDTAKRYGCESLLRVAIEDSNVLRDDIFLTTKLWPTDYGKKYTRSAFNNSLKRLGTDYIDLYMLHWPECPSNCPDKKLLIEETWRVLEKLYDEELCRAIGVCNFEINDLEALLETCSVVPHVNQFELHPFQNPIALKKFCRENKIQVEGYCPLGKGTLLTEPAIVEMAYRYKRTAAQILIRWSLQTGAVTIPKSTQPKRVNENSEVFDFELFPSDVMCLDSLHDGRRIVSNHNVREKIDSNLPDGYKLFKSLRICS